MNLRQKYNTVRRSSFFTAVVLFVALFGIAGAYGFFSTSSMQAYVESAEVVAVSVGENNFESGFVTPASCGTEYEGFTYPAGDGYAGHDGSGDACSDSPVGEPCAPTPICGTGGGVYDNSGNCVPAPGAGCWGIGGGTWPNCAPANFGSSCQSAPNACGATNSGTIQCGGCSASTPPNPAGYGNSCFSAPNSCGLRDLGRIQCDGSCDAITPSESFCAGPGPVCGNGVAEIGEQCDGGDLNGQSCSSQGFDSGTLSCTGSCTFNTSQCTTDEPISPPAGPPSPPAGPPSPPAGPPSPPAGPPSPPPLEATIDIGAMPSQVSSSSTTVINWSVENVTDCSVVGTNPPSDSWTSSGGGTFEETTGPITQRTTYTLVCTDLSGELVGDSVDVTLKLKFEEE